MDIFEAEIRAERALIEGNGYVELSKMAKPGSKNRERMQKAAATAISRYVDNEKIMDAFIRADMKDEFAEDKAREIIRKLLQMDLQ